MCVIRRTELRRFQCQLLATIGFGIGNISSERSPILDMEQLTGKDGQIV